MAEIIPISRITAVKKKTANKRTVLVGGCFDLLHPGHVIFLEKAKKAGDILVVLLEADEKVKQLKGANRPIYNQQDRAQVLSALSAVDYVVMLPFLSSDSAYDKLIGQIQPDVIVVSSKDTSLHHQRSAKKSGAQLKFVKVIGSYSTSKILSEY